MPCTTKSVRFILLKARPSSIFPQRCWCLPSNLKLKHLKIIRHKQLPVIVLPSFLRIKLFPLLKMHLFRMIQDQMRNLKLLGKLTCFFHSTVVLFIRLELICFSIQAERLMGQPVAAFHKFIIFLIVRFVTAAGKLHSVRKQHRKSELLCLRGKNIEKGDRIDRKSQGFPLSLRDAPAQKESGHQNISSPFSGS